MVIAAPVRHTLFRGTVGIPPDHRDFMMRDDDARGKYNYEPYKVRTDEIKFEQESSLGKTRDVQRSRLHFV